MYVNEGKFAVPAKKKAYSDVAKTIPSVRVLFAAKVILKSLKTVFLFFTLIL